MDVQQYLLQNYPNVASVEPVTSNGQVVGYYAKGQSAADSIYVPISAVNNPSVKMVSYMPGSGGSTPDAAVLRQKIQNNPPNYIVSIAAECSDHNNCIQTGYNVAQGLNANVDQNVTMCFSASGFLGLRNTSKFLAEHPNVKTTVISCEPYGESNFSFSKDAAPLLQNGTKVIFAVPDKAGFHIDMKKLMAEYQSQGLDTYLLGTDYGAEHHMQTNNEVIDSGFLDYLLGEVDSFDQTKGGGDGYKFYKYDPETGQIVNANFDEIKGDGIGIPDLDKILSYDSNNIEAKESPVNSKYSTLKTLSNIGNPELVTFSSEYGLAYEHMNNIRTQIKSSSFLGGVVNLTYRSTTDIPGCINTHVNDYFDIVGSLLNSLSMETESVVSYAESIVNLDKELAQEINKGKKGEIVEKDNSDKLIPLGLTEPQETQTETPPTTQQQPTDTTATQPPMDTTSTAQPTPAQTSTPAQTAPAATTTPTQTSAPQSAPAATTTPSTGGGGVAPSVGGAIGAGTGAIGASQPAQEQTPAEEQKPVEEQKPAEEEAKPTEEQPAEEEAKPTEEQPTEEEVTPTEEQPTEEEVTPTEEQPTEEETTTEEQPTEEETTTPDDLTPTEDMSPEKMGPCYDDTIEPDYVYDFEDREGYIYMNNDEIVGMKYRYKFETEEEFSTKFEELKNKYKDSTFIKDIYKNNGYIDVIFNEETFKDKSYDDMIKEYFEGGELNGEDLR